MIRQPAWLRHGATFLAVLLTLFLTAIYLTKTTTLAVPIRLHFSGPSWDAAGDAADRVSIVFVNDSQQPVQAQRLLETSYWFVENQWIRQIRAAIPAGHFTDSDRLTITIGENEPRLFTADMLRPCQIAADEKGVVVELPGDVGVPSSLPWIDKSILNWPGDFSYLRAIGQTALLPCMLIVLFAVWVSSSSPLGTPGGEGRGEGGPPGQETAVFADAAAPLTPAPLPPEYRGERGKPPRPSPSPLLSSWLGFLFLLGCFVVLEVKEPFYFTQCDTVNEDLPLILVGCRSYWRGEFPNYNPYTWLGTPLAGAGLASLTYPPTLLSYAVARHVLFNENATAEVFVILHLTAGFFLMRRLACKIGMGALAANLSALSFVLSGAALIMGRSWFNFVPIMFWLPVVFLGLLKLRDDAVSWRWVVGMGLALSMPFHIGFPQIAIYISGFFCLGVLFLAWTGSLTWKKARIVVPALVLGAGISVPLVMQQWLLGRGSDRFEVPEQGIAMGLPALLLPYPLVRVQVPVRWGNENLQLMGHVYFFGGVLAWLFFYEAVGLLFFRKRPRADWAVHVWTVCGLAALWLSLGDFGGLWTLLKWLPLVDKINRHPLRLVPFLVFFACLSGGLVLERLLKNTNPKRWRHRDFFIGAIAVTMLVWHVSQCRTAFKVVNYRPYPPLPADMQALFWKNGQATGRVLSWGRYSHNESWALQLPRNLPGVYELPGLEGQNPLIDSGPLLAAVQGDVLRKKQAALEAYGVRWHLRQRPENFTADGAVLSSTWKSDVLSQQDRLGHGMSFQQFTPVTQNDEVLVSELTSAAPLAFVDDEPAALPVFGAGTLGMLGGPLGDGAVRAACAIANSRAAMIAARDSQRLNLWMHGWGLEVDVTPLRSEKRVVVNFLRWPGMRAYVDGAEVRCLTDDWKRIVVLVGGGHRRLLIRYEPPWGQGVVYGLAIVAVGLVLTWFLLEVPRKKPAN